MAAKRSHLFSLITLGLLHALISILSHPTTPLQSSDQKISPFEFLKHLQGCHKGEKLKGIHDLKMYLEKFGYYHKTENNTHANDDDFDELLEFAVKTYQQNYHLKATGTLDAETVSKMTMPRCGVADIINGTNSMQLGNKMHHHSSSFHTVSHYTFFPSAPRWPPSKYHLTYRFHLGTPTQARSPVTRAFQTWARNTHFTFSQTHVLSNADITIGFFRRNHGDGFPFDGPGGTIAHAFAPTDGRFHYDADERYSVGATPGAFDLETVALHEIGHLLGLGHSLVQGAIMEPFISLGVTKGLHPDDIAGIRALYNV
ncbi:metalloendoproteinase 3-MMP-like [Juglans microcarpa x Juglans regia]|uniref:metalloendoproteinase 3-MMP-like n=1 Tax=Juglans microcarpa x Juglans regia TaxID=2249226 RepID=UPI001B7F770A|nr:metalloendoproteinase 3-MMP-like [Juglans microcarpa x Juglans regia]